MKDKLNSTKVKDLRHLLFKQYFFLRMKDVHVKLLAVRVREVFRIKLS